MLAILGNKRKVKNRMGTINFKSKAHADILMLKSDAQRIFSLFGRELKEQGAIEYKDMPEIEKNLTHAITDEEQNSTYSEEQTQTEPDEQNQDEPNEPAVSLKQKLHPLLKMLKSSYESKESIYWGF